jgi:hypothetical protein
VEWLHRSNEGQTFARGRVSHVDHTTIRLECWHEVVVNTEARDEQRGDLREQAQREQARREIAMDYFD